MREAGDEFANNFRSWAEAMKNAPKAAKAMETWTTSLATSSEKLKEALDTLVQVIWRANRGEGQVFTTAPGQKAP